MRMKNTSVALPPFPELAEITIIGAGVIGSALAMALGELGVQNVVVVDPDLEGVLSSSELNAGGVRATFHQDLNILCSKLSIQYFSANAEDVGYRAAGYLWIHKKQGMEAGLRSLPQWQRAGWPVEAWDVKQLQSYAPFIDRTEGLAGALFSPRDGLLNSNLLKLHYRAKAKACGVRFVDRHALRAAETDAGGVNLSFEILPTDFSRAAKEDFFTSDPSRRSVPTADCTRTFRTKRVVNCGGAWASDIAGILGYESPSYSVRRQISLFDSRDVDLSGYGLIVDPSGVYYHPEASFILAGVAERETPAGANFHYEGESFFQEKIWLPLSERSSKFDALRHLSGWGGLYEVSPDESAIIGEVTIGEGKKTGRVFESHSYSGHGVMHSYACGVALAEKLVRGRAEIFDLEAFSGDRFRSGRPSPFAETAII